MHLQLRLAQASYGPAVFIFVSNHGWPVILTIPLGGLCERSFAWPQGFLLALGFTTKGPAGKMHYSAIR
jgi:hypothetical protein